MSCYPTPFAGSFAASSSVVKNKKLSNSGNHVINSNTSNNNFALLAAWREKIGEKGTCHPL